MDKPYVKSVIEGLKSTSSSRVQESLLKIRSKLIVNDNGIRLFTDCGGLNYLVPHLRKPNERILDLTLSILGNCCLDDQCRIAVGKLHVVAPLISVLKTVCRDSIVGRACRVIGNLAQRTSNAEELHDHGAVPALVTLIESRDKNTSYPTLTMAVRSIRQLWSVSSKRGEMLSVNSVRCIAILLTTECELAGILKSTNPEIEPTNMRKSQKELITGILKCFGYFTTPATMQCAEQLQGDGRGYQCLVALTKTFEPLALRVLMNLCFLSACRPLLGTAGLVQCLVNILQRNPEVSWWPEGSARMLSQLSGESVNRARIRASGGLPLLIAAAKDNIHALRALLQYVFDDMSFQMLVNEGLISFVTAELQKHLETMEYEHNYKPPVEVIQKTDATETSHQETENDEQESKVSLFKRRKGNPKNSSEDGLKVVIERDNMYVGFTETVDSDASDSQNEEESSENSSKVSLKRRRSKSPTAFMKRARVWGVGLYWEMKADSPSTSSMPMSPEATMSPSSDGNSGFSPEYRSGKRRCDWSPESGFSTGEGSGASPYWTDNQWSPSSSNPTSPFSVVNEGETPASVRSIGLANGDVTGAPSLGSVRAKVVGLRLTGPITSGVQVVRTRLDLNEETSDSELSGRYSPVCSEHESETPTKVPPDVTPAGLDAALDELAMDDADVDPDDDEPFQETDNESYSIDENSSRIACILVLMYRLSNGSYESEYGALKEPIIPNNMLELLTGKECINALLDYVERCRKPMGRAARILTLIFGNALCLIHILKHKIALRLHNMSSNPKHPLKLCRQCRMLHKLCNKLMARLTILSEASYGIGEISFQLQRGPDSMKETLSLTLPYIVKAKAALRTYYIVCNALMILFAFVPASNEELETYVTALGKLALNIRIKDPKVLENRFTDQYRVSYSPNIDNLPKDEVVTFELDDSSTVKTNRTFLCQTSEVFSAMLMGCFKESIEESVRLKNVTKPGLEYLLTLLNCGLNNDKCEIQKFPMADKLETNLEVLLLSDRFLLERIKVLLNSAILQFAMTPNTADKIYVWSLNEGMGFLCVESVAYLLTGKMCEKERAKSFNNILSLEYKDQWLDDIKSILMRQLEDWS